MITTTTMTLEMATMITRRAPQSEREWAVMGDALRCLAAAGISFHEVQIDARRAFSAREVALFVGE